MIRSAADAVARPILADAFGLVIGLSVLFFSSLRIHMQVASVMWVGMVVPSMAALLLIPIFYSGGRSRVQAGEGTAGIETGGKSIIKK
ncbi:hypothetical protein ACFLX7_01830 [Chloroflexota bacterium]